MVLLEIDTESISGIELEGDAPRTIDVDRVAGWNETSQGMKIEPGKVHLLRRGRDIQAIEADQDPLMQRRIDLGGAAFRPQLGERLASKGPDHPAM